MELIHLRYFEKAAELQNITKAAAELQISQPSLTKIIKILENELRYDLFDRKGKYVVLNENGTIFLKYVKQVFQTLNSAVLELDDHNERKNNAATISVMAAGKFLPQIIIGFKNLHPDFKIDIKMIEGDQIEDTTCDLMLITTLDRQDRPNEITLYREKIVAVLPKTHPLAERNRIRLYELKDQEFISTKMDSAFRKIVELYCQNAGFTPNIIIASEYATVIKSLVQSGIGIALMPEYTWEEGADAHLSFIQIEEPECFRYIKLIWQPGSYISKSVDIFRSYLINFFEHLKSKDLLETER